MISWLLIVTTLSGLFALVYGIVATMHDFHEKKGDKKVLSKMGYVGLSILIFSSSLGLVVDGYKEIAEAKAEAERTKTENNRTKSENERLEEARSRDRDLNSKLGLQLDSSKQTSSDLLQALGLLKVNAQASTAISGNLNRQLGVTTTISKELSSAVTSLNHTSETASAVLTETVNRIDHLDVGIVILLDPLAMKNADGKPFFSTDVAKLTQDHNAGRINLWDDEDKLSLIQAEAKKHYGLIRDQVFEDWNLAITLDRDSGEFLDIFPETLALYERDTGVSSFFTGFSASRDDEKEAIKQFGLPCLVIYRIQPERYAGFRKYSDLDGSEWQLFLNVNDNFVRVHGAFLSAGYFQNALELSKDDFRRDDSDGAYRAEKEIPKGFFHPKNTP